MTNLPASLLNQIAKAKITCSFVVGEQGEIAKADGSSKGLGNETDLELLKTLRANAEVVLTSGLTARVEDYRMPRHADLAIFTSQGVAGLNLKPRAGQKLQLLTPPVVTSYKQSLEALLSRYDYVHVEFGPRGVKQLVSDIDLFVISSRFAGSARLFCEELSVQPIEDFELPDLFITLAVGRA